MKSKNKFQFILYLKIFLIFFIFGMSYKVFANEKNFVIATIDRSPITYYDLKQKAKLIHFLRTKNNQYENLNKYFDLSLESLISQKLLIKKAIEFNKNILDLTQKDALKYILERNNNSIEIFENFLKKNNLSKSVVILNIQIEIIKKYLIGQMFEKEYDDYLKEINDITKNKNHEIDLEQIIIKTEKKNIDIINSIEDQIDTLSNQGYSFKEIAKILSKNKLLKVSAGRSGWQNKKNFKSNTFKKLFKFPEGEIIKEKISYNLNYNLGNYSNSFSNLLFILIPIIFLTNFIYRIFARDMLLRATILNNSDNKEISANFDSKLNPATYLWITISNAIVVPITLGLMSPWAQIRFYKYLSHSTKIEIIGDLNLFLDTEKKNLSSLGEEYAEMEGIEVNI